MRRRAAARGTRITSTSRTRITPPATRIRPCGCELDLLDRARRLQPGPRRVRRARKVERSALARQGLERFGAEAAAGARDAGREERFIRRVTLGAGARGERFGGAEELRGLHVVAMPCGHAGADFERALRGL